MRIVLAALLSTGALALAAGAAASESRLAPLPREQAVSTHGPFQSGDCDVCHERKNPKSPGAAIKVSNDLCFECHDEFKGSAPVRMEKAVHPSSQGRCTTCHSPHNARKKKLLL
jgi:predicted CXXCH cytochrome family protein